MHDKEFAKLFSQILIKEKGVCYIEKDKLVVLDISKEVNSSRLYPFMQKTQFFMKEKDIWVKKLRGGSGIKILEYKVPGSKKIVSPSKAIVVMSGKDFKKLKVKQKPLITYSPKDHTVFSVMFRVNKKLQIHIDTASAKVAGCCGIDGLFTVGKVYTKENKSLALTNYKWVKNNPVNKIDCIWSDPFAKLLISMGLHLP